MLLRIVAPVLLASAQSVAGVASHAQTATPHSCHTQPYDPSAGDMALLSENYGAAETAYRTELASNPKSTAALNGLVRTMLEQQKLAEALDLTLESLAAQPNNPVLLDALGATRFRRGEVAEAVTAFNQSMQLDPCNASTYFDEYIYFRLVGKNATAQHQLDTAHKLMPDDPVISLVWRRTHAPPMTDAEVIDFFKKEVATRSLTPDYADAVNAAIKRLEAHNRGDCRIVSPQPQTTIPLEILTHEVLNLADEPDGVVLSALLNGKKKRLQVYTDAGGLVLSRSAALAAGLIPEAEIVNQLDKDGATRSFVTHVGSIRLGNLEFRNCMVEVLEKPPGSFGFLSDVDGAIGTEVFSDFLVTLDIPGGELRLSPLPQRPGDSPAPAASLDTTATSSNRQTIADAARDPYIAPEMKNWTPFYRDGHDIFVPAAVDKAPIKLFLIDLSARSNAISQDLARDVSYLAGNFREGTPPMNGANQQARDVSVTFAGVKQITHYMKAFDAEPLSPDIGVTISGYIGFPMLKELVTTIDYRDNLIHVVYNPKKPFRLD